MEKESPHLTCPNFGGNAWLDSKTWLNQSVFAKDIEVGEALISLVDGLPNKALRPGRGTPPR